LFLATVSAESLQVTSEHPFLLNGSWMEAQELKEGDLLTTLDLSQVRITRITRVVPEAPVTVYNLEAGVYHDFVVTNGLVVHNSNRIGEGFECTSCGRAQFCPLDNQNPGLCGGMGFPTRYYARVVGKEELAQIKVTGMLTSQNPGELIPVLNPVSRRDLDFLFNMEGRGVKRLYQSLGGNGDTRALILFETEAIPEVNGIPFRNGLPVHATESKFASGAGIRVIKIIKN